MRFIGLLLCFALLIAGGAQAQDSSAQSGSTRYALHEGHAGGSRHSVGPLALYEDRAAQSGRIIDLAVVVLQAVHPTHHAIAVIAGGPGLRQPPMRRRSLRMVGLSKLITPLRDTYDIVFMDDRGMQRSYPLTCSLAPHADPAAYFKQLFPDDLVRACRDKLSQTHNLALYDTSNAVDDLDDIRAALGYPQAGARWRIVWHVFRDGLWQSAATRRRWRAKLLDGVSPPHFQPLPGEPLGAQNAIGDLIAKCKRDAACHTSFSAVRRPLCCTRCAFQSRTDSGEARRGCERGYGCSFRR